jgi:REP element-mobilizing transposase RayT
MLKQRQSIRLKNYDYSKSGLYFVTICTENRECLFGDINDGKMILNDIGNMIKKLWNKIPKRFNMVELDAFQIMPAGFMPAHIGFIPARNNHAHGERIPNRATTRVAPTTIGDIIGAFKSLTTHEYITGVKYNGWKPFNKRLWQRNYYERIIRTENDLNKIREYIKLNPLYHV